MVGGILVVEVRKYGGMSIASFEDGGCVVFISASGDVFTCPVEDVESWSQYDDGPLAEMLVHLGVVGTSVEVAAKEI